MGEGWKRAVAATKATRKKPQAKGNVFAIRTRKTKSNAWMPDDCLVCLEGDPDPKGRFLQVCGWSMFTGEDDKGWLVERLKRCLPKLAQQWEEEYGKGWRLEVR